MNKRKFKKGQQIVSVAEFLEHEWFIVNGKTYHKGWCMSWSLKLAQLYVDRGVAYIAERLTNGEYYAGKTDDQLQEMLDTELCNYCEGKRKVIGSCDGAYCGEAIKVWKEEEVE